jgi:hypothetical protein
MSANKVLYPEENKHIDHEVVTLVARDDQVAGRDDGLGNLRLQTSKVAVG